MVYFCAVFGCTNRSNRDKDKSFFRLPSVKRNVGQEIKSAQEHRRNEWLKRTKRQDLTPLSLRTLVFVAITLYQAFLDDATDPWGVTVERVEMKDVQLSVQLQRAMAVEAEATREARAKHIAAEGEMNSAHSLKEAADVMSESPEAMQLRYLQTLNTISAEKNSTIVFPLPVDVISRFIPSK